MSGGGVSREERKVKRHRKSKEVKKVMGKAN